MKTKGTNTAANVGEQGAHVALEGTAPKKGVPLKKKRPTARENAKAAKAKAAGQKPDAKGKQSPAREGTKKAKVLALLGRKEGATVAQMMKATGWQKHSVRGFLSGALGKKMGLTITNAKLESGDRVYRLGK